MSRPVTLVVLLEVDPDHRDDFERYEAEAARVMARYGGRIERRVAEIRKPRG